MEKYLLRNNQEFDQAAVKYNCMHAKTAKNVLRFIHSIIPSFVYSCVWLVS